ncbi:hypothetical protein [Rhodovarius sp.]|uniref:hypothetical protein n=1 Tax=Rhodovarius sp. TaxID=2972673 RepID=UPI0033401D49
MGSPPGGQNILCTAPDMLIYHRQQSVIHPARHDALQRLALGDASMQPLQAIEQNALAGDDDGHAIEAPPARAHHPAILGYHRLVWLSAAAGAL